VLARPLGIGMKIIRFAIAGYRSLASVDWAPGPLNVVHGPGALDLLRALRLFSRTTQGWSAFADEMRAEEATAATFWHPEAIEARWFVKLAPSPDGDLDFGHELIVERLDGPPWWCVGYERLTLSDDFDTRDVLERMGDRVEHFPPRRALPGTSFTVPSKSNVQRVASDMLAYAAMRPVAEDPRLGAHAAAIASWSFHRPWATSPSLLPEPPDFHGTLYEDAANLTRVLANIHDWHAPRARFERALRRVIPGADGLAFPETSAGTVTAALRLRDGTSLGLPELPPEVLRAVALLAAAGSPEPPGLLWLHAPAEGLAPHALPVLMEVLGEATARTQVVLSGLDDPSLPALAALAAGLSACGFSA
jgi:hypothetical protein